MNKKIIISLAVFLILGVFIYFVGIDNLKLNLSRYWGYFTLDNNPLLSDYDKDLKGIKDNKSTARISLENLLSGGPGKDGIPSIDNPKFTNASESKFQDEELIVGVYLNGEARAYPYGVLNWHEIINDKIGDTPLAITLCPLCDTNPVFIRKVNGIETTFGVSGKLFQSCLVMYDRLTDTLWSQPWGTGIVGKNVNSNLSRIPSVKTTLGKWKQKYPKTLVLSDDTGYNRNYFRYPYGDYYTNSKLIFPARNQDKLDIHPKQIISYIWKANNDIPQDMFSGNSLSISHELLRKKLEKTMDYDGKKVRAIWDKDLETIKFFDGEIEIPSSTAFGFVYPAFFDTNNL